MLLLIRKLLYWIKQSKAKQEEFELFFEVERAKIQEGAELPPGVQKMVKVYVATRKNAAGWRIRWLDAMEIKVLFLVCLLWKTCHT